MIKVGQYNDVHFYLIKGNESLIRAVFPDGEQTKSIDLPITVIFDELFGYYRRYHFDKYDANRFKEEASWVNWAKRFLGC